MSSLTQEEKNIMGWFRQIAAEAEAAKEYIGNHGIKNRRTSFALTEIYALGEKIDGRYDNTTFKRKVQEEKS